MGVSVEHHEGEGQDKGSVSGWDLTTGVLTDVFFSKSLCRKMKNKVRSPAEGGAGEVTNEGSQGSQHSESKFAKILEELKNEIFHFNENEGTE